MIEQVFAVAVPGPLQFLNWGWWILHVIGIVVLLLIGYALGRKCAAGKPTGPAAM